jgi:hypothetical protein
MRSALLGLSAAVVLALSAPASYATTFTWSFTDGGTNTGSGTFEAFKTTDPGDPTNHDVFQVTSISGTALGQTINSLSNYGSANNYIYWNPSSPTHFDSAHPYYHAGYFGMGFTLANGDNYDLYEEAGTQLASYTCGDPTVPYCLLGPSASNTDSGANGPRIALTDFAVAAQTPLPASLPLFASGLGGLGFAAYRRKRKQA